MKPSSTRPSGPRPRTGRPTTPDPGRLASLLVRIWLEVRSGRRPLAQLAPLVAPAARRRLAAQLPTVRDIRPTPVPRVRTVVVRHPARDVCEAVVLVEGDVRTTAFAVRIERHRGLWRAVELTAPEMGLRPLPTASLGVDAPLRDAFDDVLDEDGETYDLRRRDSA
jgi:hypothetical protein